MVTSQNFRNSKMVTIAIKMVNSQNFKNCKMVIKAHKNGTKAVKIVTSREFQKFVKWLSKT